MSGKGDEPASASPSWPGAGFLSGSARPVRLLTSLLCASVLIALLTPICPADSSKRPLRPPHDIHCIHCTVLDADTGDTLSTRSRVLGSDSYPRCPWPPEDCIFHSSMNGFFYADGPFVVVVPPGPTLVEVTHGLEYIPDHVTLFAESDTTLVFELSRWIDMPAAGWYGGDSQAQIAHAGGEYELDAEDALLLARAEDLSVVTYLDNDYLFTGEPIVGEGGIPVIFFSEEYRSSVYGHLALLNIPQLIRPGYFGSTTPLPLNKDVCDSVHSFPGAAVFYAHPHSTCDFFDTTEWPGGGLARGLPMDLAYGGPDGIEVASYGNQCEGNWIYEYWYRLLNAGYRVSPTAGTDAAMNRLFDLPLGGYRVYVYLDDEPLTYENWVEGLVKGRSFITNCPMFTEFHVEGCIPGDSLYLEGEGPHIVHGHARVECMHPIQWLEIVVNGEVVQSFHTTTELHVIDEDFTVHVDGCCWIAARCIGRDLFWHTVGDSLRAHTAPVYVRVGDDSLVTHDDVEFLLDWMDTLDIFVRETGGWGSPVDSLYLFNSLSLGYLLIHDRISIPPEPFCLLSPQCGTCSMDPSPRFDWEDTYDLDPPDSALTYTIWISNDTTFIQRIEMGNLPESEFTPNFPLRDQSIFFWRVKATAGLKNRWCNQMYCSVWIDTLGTVAGMQGEESPLELPEPTLWVAPNPSSGDLHIRWTDGRDAASASKGGEPVRRCSSRLVEIYDVRGRLIRTLGAPHRQSIMWDGCDFGGVPVASGVYFCQLAGCSAGQDPTGVREAEFRKVVLVR